MIAPSPYYATQKLRNLKISYKASCQRVFFALQSAHFWALKFLPFMFLTPHILYFFFFFNFNSNCFISFVSPLSFHGAMFSCKFLYSILEFP
jgi:hypothetical protein